MPPLTLEVESVAVTLLLLGRDRLRRMCSIGTYKFIFKFEWEMSFYR